MAYTLITVNIQLASHAEEFRNWDNARVIGADKRDKLNSQALNEKEERTCIYTEISGSSQTDQYRCYFPTTGYFGRRIMLGILLALPSSATRAV